MGARGLTRRNSVAERARSRRRSHQGKLKSSHHRGLRIEQFEDRLLLSIGTWLPEGPAPIDLGQVTNVGPKDTSGNYLNEVTGAVQAVAANPANPNILYVGAANGGVWRTDNATATNPTWTPLTDSQSSLSIGAIAFDPTDPTNQTLVAGIGRWSDFGLAGGNLTGILRTTDGGATWTQLDGGGLLDGKDISGIAARGNTILVSVDRADSGSLADAGIFRSTDGGLTFTQLSKTNGQATGLPGGVAYDLAADPTQSPTSSTRRSWAPSPWRPEHRLQVDQHGRDLEPGEHHGRRELHPRQRLVATTNIRISVGSSNNVYVGIVNAKGGDPATTNSPPCSARGTAV